jgi:CRP/FNR family transcriptional regulator
MTTSEPADQWEAHFPFVRSMTERDRRFARSSLLFARLNRGAVAYEFDAPCAGYQMCVNGGTWVCRPTAARLDVGLYRVTAGEACALTTQSLLSGQRLAARSVAEMETELAVLPSEAFADLMRSSAPFRDFVLRDYFGLASKLSLLFGNRGSRRCAPSRSWLVTDCIGE